MRNWGLPPYSDCGSMTIRIEPVADGELLAAHVESSRVKAYRLFGSLSLDAFEQLMCLVDFEREAPRVLVVDLTSVHSLHETAFEGMIALHKLVEAKGGRLLLCGVNHQPVSLMKRGGLEARIGPTSFPRDLQDCLTQATSIVNAPVMLEGTTAKSGWRHRIHNQNARVSHSTGSSPAMSADAARGELSGATQRSDLSHGMGD